MTGLWILFAALCLIAVGEGLTVVAFMAAADTENRDPATAELEEEAA